MPKRRAATADAVDWSSLPDEVLLLVAELLHRRDIKNTSTVCKAWRRGLRDLVLHDLQILLSDVTHDAPSTRARRQDLRADLGHLLRHALPGTSLAVSISGRHWPVPSQFTTLLDAISRQPRLQHLCIELMELMDCHTSKAIASFVDMTKQLCAALATRAPHVTSFKLSTGALPIASQDSIFPALAQLCHLQQLTLCSKELSAACLSRITCLTNLTALHLGSMSYWHSASLQQRLQQLAQLSSLQSLTLLGDVAKITDEGAQPLPAWPHLRHFHLDNRRPFQHHNILLSAEHCARLETLTVGRFHAAPGVSSMQQLAKLDALNPPLQPAPADAGAAMPQLQDQRHEVLDEFQNQALAMQAMQAAAQELEQQQAQQEQEQQQEQQQQELEYEVLLLQQQMQQLQADNVQLTAQLMALNQQIEATEEQMSPKQQHLHFPKLQQLALHESHPGRFVAVASLLSEAPQLVQLYLGNVQGPYVQHHLPAQGQPGQTGLEQQAARQLLAAVQQLHAFKMPRASFMPDLPGFGRRMMQQAAQHGVLQRLSLQHRLLPQHYPLLQALSSLQALSLQSTPPEVLAHLPPQLTALTFTYDNKPSPGTQPAAPVPAKARKLPPLRRLCLSCHHADSVLRLLPLYQLTGLTGLGMLFTEAPPACAQDISRLTGLQELEAWVWPGMAQQLAGLKQLRSLTLHPHVVGAHGLEGQVTQRRRLQLAQGGVTAEVKQLGLRLAQMLPRCMVSRCAVSMRNGEEGPGLWAEW